MFGNKIHLSFADRIQTRMLVDHRHRGARMAHSLHHRRQIAGRDQSVGSEGVGAIWYGENESDFNRWEAQYYHAQNQNK